MSKALIFLITATFIAISCGKVARNENIKIIDSQKTQNLEVFFKTMKKFTLDVYYEEGAEPFGGVDFKGKYTWNITEDNIKKVFSLKSLDTTYSIPKELSEMTSLGRLGQESWSVRDILNLEQVYRKSKHFGDEGSLFVVFLKGNFRNDDGEINDRIIGISISGTTIIAIFKDVIVESTAGPLEAAIMEQTTLVHEFGHAIGLVNNGLPLASDHQDVENGAHCTNENCVLHWKNEGREDIIRLIRSIILTGENLLFDESCLQDVKAY